jgi:Leucine-rich repeat (LRR) protein
LRSILLFSLRSLVFYNGDKIQSSEKDFADNKIKVTKELIKANNQCIVNKPRSLSYLFVAETLRDKSTNAKKLESRNSTFLSTSPHGLIDNQGNDLFSKITTLNLDNLGLYKLTNMDYLVNLKWASFNNNFICKIEGLGKCVKLEELSFENNLIQSLNGLENLENLRKLNLNCNEIFLVDDHTDSKQQFKLTKLVYLSLSKNKLASFKFLSHFTSLIEFYASFNQLKNLRDVFHLKNVTNLTLCDLSGNPISKNAKYRLFIIYHLKNLKSLDGNSIELSESNEAKEHFGGKLTCDFIAEKFQNVRLNDIKSLEFPQCGIKVVDLGASIQSVSEQFENLRAINLENNALTSFSGLVYLRNLKILCLNNNKVESIFPKSKNASNTNTLNDLILPNLEVLHLAFNGINDLVTLQIGRLVSLKALFLQGLLMISFFIV